MTRLGEILFNKSLDFAWCHMVVRANLLEKILPKYQYHDMTIFGETALYLKDYLVTKDVDWLSWEDPFIFDKDQKTFKEEREQNPQENEKRLSYVLPIIQFLLKYS
ncbi:MAG: hypothetical protein ACOX50_03060 [Patescibacteria group bacterium]